MALKIGSRLKSAWNAFRNEDPLIYYQDLGSSNSTRPDRPRLTRGRERSIVTSVYNQISIDASAIAIKHVLLDVEGRYSSDMNSALNTCLLTSANLDQTGRAFRHDVYMSLLDEGCIAIVPIDTDDDPEFSETFGIESLRTGKILEWYPKHVKVSVYNEETGRLQDLIMPKSAVAIVENPFYAVFNEPNSTMQRLIQKLNLLDAIDQQSGSGKLDLIIQLPYVVKTKLQEAQAKKRREEIENQLAGSKYGIAYTDGTERITQLNRPAENNLMKQIEYLTSMLYSQLGITQSILDGSADAETMHNYYIRTIEPIVSAVVDEMNRKFLSPTARENRQAIDFFRDPFKLVPVGQIGTIGETFKRSKILSSNEVRHIIGRKPSDDPEADKLNNPNLNPQPTNENLESPDSKSEENESISEENESKLLKQEEEKQNE